MGPAPAEVGEGYSAQLVISVENTGDRPLSVLSLKAAGLGRGERVLAWDRGEGPRGFGFVGPGEIGEWRLGVYFDRPGTGELILQAELRALPPEAQGALMEAHLLEALSPHRRLERALPLTVSPRALDRAAAVARAGCEADLARFSPLLEGWALWCGNGAWVVTGSSTERCDGLSPEALALAEARGGALWLLDPEGVWRHLSGAAEARAWIERACRRGLIIDTTPRAHEEALQIGP